MLSSCSTSKVLGQLAATVVCAEAVEVEAQAQAVTARASATKVRVVERGMAAP